MPLAVAANQQVLEERARLWEIRQRQNGGELSIEDRLWLAGAAEKYGAQASDVGELGRRIDAVPTSILIALAGLSTGWNIADQSGWRALFLAASGAVSRTPSSALPGGEAPSLGLSLAALSLYVRVLNTHPDFLPFRKARERLRHDGVPLQGPLLTATLPRIAPGRLPGAMALSHLIDDQQLERFDADRLAQPPT